MSQSVVDKCNEAGVPIIAVDDGLIDTEGNKIAPWFGIDAYNIGYTAGEWMADYATENNLLEDPEVGLLYMTMETVSSCVPRTEGEQDAWADKVGDALSDRTYYADYVSMSEEAYNSASAVITAHPEITKWLVMTPSENGVLGCGAVLEEQGPCGETAASSRWAPTRWPTSGRTATTRSAALRLTSPARSSAVRPLPPWWSIWSTAPRSPMEYATPAVIVTPDDYQDKVL